VLQSLRNPRVLLLGIVYLGVVTPNYGISFFLPQIVNAFEDEQFRGRPDQCLPLCDWRYQHGTLGRHSDAVTSAPGTLPFPPA